MDFYSIASLCIPKVCITVQMHKTLFQSRAHITSARPHPDIFLGTLPVWRHAFSLVPVYCYKVPNCPSSLTSLELLGHQQMLVCAIQYFFSEDRMEKKPFLQSGGRVEYLSLQASWFFSSAYQTPLKAILLHYASQFTPKRQLLTHTSPQSKLYKTHTRPFSKLTFILWGNLQLLL